MLELIGVTIPVHRFFKAYNNAWYSDLLKHQYILADKICIPDLDVARSIAPREDFDIIDPNNMLRRQSYDLPAEIDWLEEHGIICPKPKGYDKKRESFLDSFFGERRALIMEWIDNASKKLSPKEVLLENVEITRTFNSLMVYETMVRLRDTTQNTVVSLVDKFDSKPQVPIWKVEDVLQIVLTRIPVPDAGTPWEDLIAFRNEPDSIERNAALRRWVRKIAKTDFSRNELEEELEWLMYEYSKYMEIQKMKYKWTTVEALIRIPLELLENLLKIKWSRMVEPFFRLKTHKIKALEAELNAPAREISYVIEAGNRLQ